MIERDDLRAAVGAGTLTEAQAASLVGLADARRRGRLSLRPGEEPFELFRGFNEIFIVVGLGILSFGWFGVWSLVIADAGNFRTVSLVAGIATLVLIALLAEYFIRRRRMIAPAIALTVGWAAAAFAFWSMWNRSISVFGGMDLEGSVLPLALTTATTFAYWLRYRVPFAMAILAASAFGCLMVGLASLSEVPLEGDNLFRLSSEGPFAWGTLLFGLALFALAMRFDMSDPHRVGLRSANGFWLHIIAAPAIVNTVALTLIGQDTGPASLALGLLLLAFALVAIAIDRRSFLISAVGYLVALIVIATDGQGAAPTILALGALLVGLGAGWQSVRALILRYVPPTLRERLPPSA
ncbi:hypothetical protein [uncultured Jannaschia sp.]|uniref:hypothetical protein n=1 Tax=uncultured Jannaschia sp. TaxID=293347 RepID=UPI00260B9616|nr:hypothetical protein [uncultured Jannaschia sp.]